MDADAFAAVDVRSEGEERVLGDDSLEALNGWGREEDAADSTYTGVLLSFGSYHFWLFSGSAIFTITPEVCF